MWPQCCIKRNAGRGVFASGEWIGSFATAHGMSPALNLDLSWLWPSNTSFKRHEKNPSLPLFRLPINLDQICKKLSENVINLIIRKAQKQSKRLGVWSTTKIWSTVKVKIAKLTPSIPVYWIFDFSLPILDEYGTSCNCLMFFINVLIK